MGTWPHAPSHNFDESGAYMVTAGTYGRVHHFASPEKLDLVRDTLFCLAEEYSFLLQAWAVLSNHYHFIVHAPEGPENLRKLVSRLHSATATLVNRMDGTPGRKVWYQYWDTRLTFQRSYYARLNYVHQNPVHHKLVPVAAEYPWCSARWFETSANPSFIKTISSFKIDTVKVYDAF